MSRVYLNWGMGVESTAILLRWLIFAGTVPQFAGVHKCALKFKAFVLDRWLAQNNQESIATPSATTLKRPREFQKRIRKPTNCIWLQQRRTKPCNEGERVRQSTTHDFLPSR